MKASEVQLQKAGYFSVCKTKKGNYKFLMSLGRVFPATKTQAKFFISTNAWLNLESFNLEDLEIIQALLNKHGYEGNYKYTRSGKWVNLINKEDLKNALKKEYDI